MFLSIGKVALILGVSINTLRRWDKEQKFQASTRTIGGHRRYDINEVGKLMQSRDTDDQNSTEDLVSQHTIVTYARVSSSKQVKDLETQSNYLKNFAIQQGWTVLKEYQDIGSGLNDQRKGLLKLLHDLPILRPTKIVVSYLDRLARFGTGVIQAVGELFGVEVVSAQHLEQTPSYEEQLTQDIIAILTSFAGKLHRSRRGRQQTPNQTDGISN